MNLGELKTRIFERLGENLAAPVFYTASEVTAAVNHAQQLFAFLTLCVEGTQTLLLNQGEAWYTSDFGHIVLLKCSRTDGTKVKPSRLADLDALDPDWQKATQGPPERYAQLGARLLAVYPPSSAAQSMVVNYAASPALLSGDSDVPQIPEEDHPALVDFAVPLLRCKEGADQLQKELPRLDEFLKAAAKRATVVKARNLAQRYDVVPVEISRIDKSKLLRFAEKNPKPEGLKIPQAEEKQ